MNDDEDLFFDSMRSLGVAPLDRRKGKGPAPEDSAHERRARDLEPGVDADADDALFRASVEGLEVVPDKDRVSPRRRREPVLRKLKPAKSRGPEPEATLDLHGQTAEQARRNVQRFVGQAIEQRMKAVVVVTGKGLRSERGVSVLKQAVETWLRHKGKQWVRAYSEAPRALGGRGAYILYLR